MNTDHDQLYIPGPCCVSSSIDVLLRGTDEPKNALMLNCCCAITITRVRIGERIVVTRARLPADINGRGLIKKGRGLKNFARLILLHTLCNPPFNNPAYAPDATHFHEQLNHMGLIFDVSAIRNRLEFKNETDNR